MAGNRNKKGRAQSAATPASSSISSTIPTASTTNLADLPFFVGSLTSDSSFPVDIDDNLTVGHLKDAIVKKKPLAFQDVDPDELDLWKVSGFTPTYADNFPTRHPFRLTGNSRTRLAINSFLKVMCYWRQPDCRNFFHHLVPLRRRFTSLYDIRVLASRLFDPSLLVKYR